MRTHHAEGLVPGEPSAVRAAIVALAEELWGDRCRTLRATADEHIHAVASDVGADVADVWVTWRLAGRTHGTTVDVTVDELDAGPDPELEALLAALARRVPTSPAANE